MSGVAALRDGADGPGPADLRAATSRLRGRVRRTPTMRTWIPTPSGPREVVLKLEQTQVSGSFKARGVLNAVLRAAEEGRLPAAGLVIASGGNAGIAAAVAGRAVGTRATVAVPHDAPAAKVRRLRDLGAAVVDDHADHEASNAWADSFAAETGALRLHAYDLPDMLSGAGTILLEAVDQEPDVTTAIVAVGGGGLVAGTVIAGGMTGVRTVAVEPVGAPTLQAALAAGRPVDVGVDTIARDSLGARRIGALAWQVCRDADLESVLVTDDAIRAARRLLWREHRLLVENAGACGLAALTSGAWQDSADELPLVVLCGANVDDPFDAEIQTGGGEVLPSPLPRT